MPERTVIENTLFSSDLPDIRIKIDSAFSYIGKFEFTLKETVSGERFVFVDADQGQIQRLFILQFEGFLPDNDYTYNYNFEHAENLAGFRFRQNTWAYSNTEALQVQPMNEGGMTAKFLQEKGYAFEDEFVMSRFLMVPDEARRHELILFYLENASLTGRNISTFYDDQDNPTPFWENYSKRLTLRSREAFEIIPSSCHSLTALSWLTGTWQAESTKNITQETWHQAGRATIEGQGQTFDTSTGAQRSFEALRLVSMAGEVFYLAKVAHNSYPTAFKLTHCTENRFIFDNPDHDFPKRIIYHLEDEGQLLVTVSGSIEENDNAQSFSLKFFRQN